MPSASDFRARLVAREPLYGAWSAISSPVSVRLLAAAGLDYVVVDLQHGTATQHDLPSLTEAIQRAGAVPVGRVRHAHAADIGRALDLGCAGVIVPNVNSAAQARDVAGACELHPDDPVLRPVLEKIWAACAAISRDVSAEARTARRAIRHVRPPSI